MVSVAMGIDHVPYRFFRKLPDLGDSLIDRFLIHFSVDKQDAIFAIGGYMSATNGALCATAALFDPQTLAPLQSGNWTTYDPVRGGGVAWPSLGSYGDSLYLAGGVDVAGMRANAYEFYPFRAAGFQWSDVAALPMKRAYHGGTSASGKVWAAAGAGGEGTAGVRVSS